MRKMLDRSPQEVLDDHLRESPDGSIEGDLARNYSDDLVVLTGRGVDRGHSGFKQLAEVFRNELPDASVKYRTWLGRMRHLPTVALIQLQLLGN